MIFFKQGSAQKRRVFARIFSLFVVLILPLFAGPVVAGEITVLTPMAGSVIYARQPLTHLVVKVTNSVDLNQLVLEGKDDPIKPAGVWNSKGNFYIHFTLGLKPGRNSFVLNPGDQEIKVSYRPLRTLININFDAPTVYRFHRKEKIPAECGQCHTSDLPAELGVDPEQQKLLYGNFAFSPECYSCHPGQVRGSNWQHGPAANILCNTCHNNPDAGGKISVPGGKMIDLCSKCHVYARGWSKMAHMHGPTGTGDCTICHNPHGDKYKFQLWADGAGEICVACHRDKKRFLTEPRSVRFRPHGIVQGAGCIACHSPHASPNRFQLHKPINDLCSGCHLKMKGMRRGHPVGGHPLKGVQDLRRPERELACSGCHNPHGSEFKYILIGDNLGGHVCTKCHH